MVQTQAPPTAETARQLADLPAEAVAMRAFAARAREAFETGTTISAILNAIQSALHDLLVDPGCLEGLPFLTDAFRSWLVYVDPDHQFAISVSHQRPRHARGVHDHGELGWAVYGLQSGEITQYIYERLDDGSVPGQARLRALDPVRQTAGDATIVPVGWAHAPHNETDEDAWVVVIRSRDLTEIWRNFYDVKMGTVYRMRKSGE